MVYVEVTLKVGAPNRSAAEVVYNKHKGPFLSRVPGARSKQLFMRDEDVKILYGFASAAQAKAYLESGPFAPGTVSDLTPLIEAAPDIRVYDAFRTTPPIT